MFYLMKTICAPQKTSHFLFLCKCNNFRPDVFKELILPTLNIKTQFSVFPLGFFFLHSGCMHDHVCLPTEKGHVVFNLWAITTLLASLWVYYLLFII